MLRFSLFLAGPGENGPQGVIAFVTSVLVNWAVARNQGKSRTPGFRECRRIVNRKLIDDRLRVGASKTYDQMQVRIGPMEAGVFGEIGGVDHQRLTLPMADRVAHPQPYRGWRMRAPIQGNHADVMNHFTHNHHVVRRLHDLEVVVVYSWKHRRPG